MTRLKTPLKTVLRSTSLLMVGFLMAGYSPAQCIETPAHLVAWWPGDGNALDRASGFDGQLVGDAGFAPGLADEAFSLDGAGDYITIPHHPTLQPLQITISAWIRGELADQADLLSVIVDKSHGFLDQTGWALQTDRLGRASFAYGNGTGFPEVLSSTHVLDGGWHLVTGTLDGSFIRIYVDGWLENELPYWGIPAENERAVNIGASFGGPSGFARFFSGLVDEVDIFSRALTQDEIWALSDAGTDGKCKQPSFLTIRIDIKPGAEPNSVNCNNDSGVISVAVLTTSLKNGEDLDFDATTIDQTSLSFQGAFETHHHRRSGEIRRHEEDVDRDGDTDLIFHFRMGDTDLNCDSSAGNLTGTTFDGKPVVGSDSIRMVGGTRVITVGHPRRPAPRPPKTDQLRGIRGKR